MSRRRVVAAVVCAVLVVACRGELRFDESLDAGADVIDAATSRDYASCNEDGDCGLATLHCEPATKRCVACTQHEQCAGATPRCDPVLFRCVACISADDCTTPRTCDPATRACLRPCRDHDDDDCPTGTRCNERTRRCAACAETSHCGSASGLTCDTSTGRCIACRTDEACGGLRCDTFVGRCVECVSASDCPKDRPACDVALGVCAAPR